MLLLPPPLPLPSPRPTLLFASLSLSIHLPSPFPILSVSSTREGRIVDVFTIVVSLDRKVRRGCRYRACSLPISFLRASPPPLSTPFFPFVYSIAVVSDRCARGESESRAVISRYSSRLPCFPRAIVISTRISAQLELSSRRISHLFSGLARCRVSSYGDSRNFRSYLDARREREINRSYNTCYNVDRCNTF